MKEDPLTSSRPTCGVHGTPLRKHGTYKGRQYFHCPQCGRARGNQRTADRQRDEATRGTHKTCPTCKVSKLRSDFWGNNGTRDGLSSNCITCYKARRTELDIARGRRLVVSKVCCVCQLEKPCYEFHHSPHSYDHLSSWCLTCSKNPASKMVCNKCGEMKDAAAFMVDRKSPNGRRPICKVCKRNTHRDWYKRNPEWQVARRNKLRANVLAAYGNRCTCCGESTPEFLSVDHIYNDGAEHRREASLSGGSRFYEWLKKQGFPQDRFQLLCYNCNFAKGRYGQCPHVKNRKRRRA